MQDDPDFTKMVASRISHKSPTSLEIRMMEILNKYFPNEWRFTGGKKKEEQFPVAGKLPDFVHINKNLIIETYGGYYHDKDNPQDKIDLYKKFGYNALVFRTVELKDEKTVVDKISALIKSN